ncbi:MAG: hypothetical protein DHS20C18_41840 [Saprospiraceae bacterium]|nr:MAG: hypothetical protein DHS20C18_41840 [Saprospiraceae bacterium]
MDEAISQEFAPIGAVWHVGTYRTTTTWDINYDIIESVGDTIIAGKNCRIIDIPATCNNVPSPQYMYMEDEKLYYFSPVEFDNPEFADAYIFFYRKNQLSDF